MKATLRYYFSVFLRKLHWFLIPAVAISAVGIIIAMTLPPAYVSQTRFVVEQSQIPQRLAPPTVTSAPLERLQIIEQRLLARANLIDVARAVNLPGNREMSADALADYMRTRTTTKIITSRGGASQMVVSFEAGSPQMAAAVVNEYLNQIQRDDVEARAGSASQTFEFFQQEVDRLATAMNAQSARILEFKTKNADALPQDQPFRQQQMVSLQGRIEQIDRDVASLTEQRARLVQIFETTGQVGTVSGAGETLTPQQRQLEQMRNQLNQSLAIYTPDNPRIKVLRSQIAQLETAIGAAPTQAPGAKSPLQLQLDEIDGRVANLRSQQEQLRGELQKLNDASARATANAVTLDALERDYASIQGQYSAAQARQFEAETSERIERQSRGQRITILEQPAAASAPTKPNRVLIVAGGVGAGILVGLALVVLLDLLNRSPRRGEDLVKKLGIMPIATIPYIRSSREMVWQRSLKAALILFILIVVPAIVWGIHTYYQPLDLLAERVKEKIGL